MTDGAREKAAMGAMTAWVAPVDPAVLARTVVISPHFDDAVLSCGRLLAEVAPATVVTITGGDRRDGYDEVTWWDALGGFQPGDDVVATRRKEDVAALGVLGCTSTYLEFTDHQYDKPHPAAARPPISEVAAALEARLDELRPTAVFVPIGLANPDHVMTGDACLELVARRLDAWSWFAYAEAGYSHIPGLLTHRLARAMKAGVWPTPAPLAIDGHLDEKIAALRCYTTQIGPLTQDWALDIDRSPRVPESYWRLEAPPAGWALSL
ncbi:MAG TPA: PIG-L family deacetylase [Mycobacteriales bacterium]|nr:PIG-L family deacetylase [Mycobacteriales bacterium]